MVHLLLALPLGVASLPGILTQLVRPMFAMQIIVAGGVAAGLGVTCATLFGTATSLAVCSLLGPCWVGAAAAWHIAQARRPRTWKSVDGIVVGSRVERVWPRIRLVDVVVDPVDTLGSWNHWAPLVVYRYRVCNDEYETGDFWYPTESRSCAEWAARTIKAYPRGRTIQVRYDPRDPRHAVVHYGARLDLIVPAGVVAAACGVAGLLVGQAAATSVAWLTAAASFLVNAQSVRALNLATAGTVRGAYWYQRKL